MLFTHNPARFCSDWELSEDYGIRDAVPVIFGHFSASRKGWYVISHCAGQFEKDRGKETVPLLWPDLPPEARPFFRCRRNDITIRDIIAFVNCFGNFSYGDHLWISVRDHYCGNFSCFFISVKLRHDFLLFVFDL